MCSQTNKKVVSVMSSVVFTVEAETDVGSTGPSTNSNTSGFPKINVRQTF